jgi:hypothetical protein
MDLQIAPKYPPNEADAAYAAADAAKPSCEPSTSGMTPNDHP